MQQWQNKEITFLWNNIPRKDDAATSDKFNMHQYYIRLKWTTTLFSLISFSPLSYLTSSWLQPNFTKAALFTLDMIIWEKKLAFYSLFNFEPLLKKYFLFKLGDWARKCYVSSMLFTSVTLIKWHSYTCVWEWLSKIETFFTESNICHVILEM